MFSTKIWFVKKSTRIVKYKSRVVKSSLGTHALMPNKVHFDRINWQSEICPLNGTMLSSIQICCFGTYKD